MMDLNISKWSISSGTCASFNNAASRASCPTEEDHGSLAKDWLLQPGNESKNVYLSDGLTSLNLSFAYFIWNPKTRLWAHTFQGVSQAWDDTFINWESTTKHLSQFPKQKCDEAQQSDTFHRMGKRRASHHRYWFLIGVTGLSVCLTLYRIFFSVYECVQCCDCSWICSMFDINFSFQLQFPLQHGTRVGGSGERMGQHDRISRRSRWRLPSEKISGWSSRVWPFQEGNWVISLWLIHL